MAIWDDILGLFEAALSAIHGGIEPLFGVHAWGWAIIVLTVIVRLLLTPLAIKQFRSMRAMQEIQPEIKQLQKKHKVDRDLLKKDPETYKARKQKLNEEMMALYKERGVNPAAGCLPLLPQIPIFFALYRVLYTMPELSDASFYFITAGGNDGLATAVRDAGWAGIVLALTMAASMFISQRQTMARSGPVEGMQAQQQKIMLYAMPVFLTFISFSLPLGVLVYWVTTNLWQMGQQAIILREVKHELEDEVPLPAKPGAAGNGKAASPGSKSSGSASSGKKSSATSGKGGNGARSTPTEGATSDDSAAPDPSSNDDGEAAPAAPRHRSRDHLPRRPTR